MAHFGSIFPIFGAQFFSPENLTLSCSTSYGLLVTCQNLEKLMIEFQENARTKGGTDKPYFIGPFRLPPGVQKYLSQIFKKKKKTLTPFICAKTNAVVIF